MFQITRYRKSALTAEDQAYLETLIEYNDYDYDSYDDGESDSSSSQATEPANFSFTEVTERTGFQMDEHTLLDCQWRAKKNSCGEQVVLSLRSSHAGSN